MLLQLLLLLSISLLLVCRLHVYYGLLLRSCTCIVLQPCYALLQWSPMPVTHSGGRAIRRQARCNTPMPLPNFEINCQSSGRFPCFLLNQLAQHVSYIRSPTVIPSHPYSATLHYIRQQYSDVTAPAQVSDSQFRTPTNFNGIHVTPKTTFSLYKHSRCWKIFPQYV